MVRHFLQTSFFFFLVRGGGSWREGKKKVKKKKMNAERVAAMMLCCQKRKGHPMHLLRQEPSIARLVFFYLGVLSMKNLDCFHAGSSGVRDVQFHPRTGRVFVLTRKQVLVFNTLRPGWPKVLSVPSPFPSQRTLSSLSAHAELPLAVVSDLFGSLALLDTTKFSTLQTLRLDRRCYDGSIGGLHFHPSKALLAVGTKQRLLLFRGQKRRFELLLRPSFACAGYVHTVRLHPTAPLCFFADHQGGVHVANLKTGGVRILPFVCASLCTLASMGNRFGLAAVSSFSGVQVCSVKGAGAKLRIRREPALEAALGGGSSGRDGAPYAAAARVRVQSLGDRARVSHPDRGSDCRNPSPRFRPDATPRPFGFGPCSTVLLGFHPLHPLLVVVVAGKDL